MAAVILNADCCYDTVVGDGELMDPYDYCSCSIQVADIWEGILEKLLYEVKL